MVQLVLKNARPLGASALADVVVDRGGIVQILPAGAAPRASEMVDLDGRWLVPGLWDAHVHFTQWARRHGRVDVSAAGSAQEVCARMARERGEGMSVGLGFRRATWDAPPTLAELDHARAAPTVVLSGDLHTAWVNTAAARELGLAHGGLLVEDDAFAVERALDGEPVAPAAVARATAAAHARGVVGIVDLEFADNATVWRERVASGLDTLRVHAGFYPDLLEERVRVGAATGTALPGTGGMVAAGPLKVITDGSLNSRTAHCLDPYPTGGTGVQNVAPAELRELMSAAHAAGIACAIHAIGDAANRIALDAFEATSARGSIEHAQLLAPEDLGRFARLGVTASVQPEHAVDDRDATDAIWASHAHRAYPLRALLDAGARLTLGSDAPVAPLDPWRAIAAAVHRTGDARPSWHPEQAITAMEALAASTRHPVAAGAPADLVACDHDPLTAPAGLLRTMSVALTVVAGRVVHRAL